MDRDRENNYWKRIQRRQLLKGAAVAGVGAAGLALVGCGDDDNTKNTPTGPAATATPNPKVDGIAWTQNEPGSKLAPKAGGTLKYGAPLRAATLDPIKSTSFETANVYTPVYNKLFRGKFGSEMAVWNPWKLELQPDLAASMPENPSPGVYVIKVRPGVKWQDVAPVSGRAFTADDVKFTLESYAKSAEFGTVILPLDKVEVTAPDTVTVTLKQPRNFLIPLLAECRVVMLPKEVAAADGDFSKKAIGTGPFILSEYTAGTSAAYKKNPNYHVQGRPYIDGINYDVYKDEATSRANFIADKYHIGRGDGLGSDQLKTISDARKDAVILRMQSRWQTSVFHTAFRADKSPGNDPRLVKALSKGWDRQAFGKLTFGTEPFNVLGPYPWADWFDKEPDLGDAYRFDPTAAKALLSAAGQTDLKVTFEYAQYSQGLVDQVQFMKEQLKTNLGVTLDAQLVDIVAYSTKLATASVENGAVGFIGTIPRYAPLSAILLWHSTSTRNTYKIKDNDMDAALDKLTTSTVPADQKQAFQAFWNILVGRPYITSVAEGPTYFMWSPKLHNYLPNEYHDPGGWGYQAFENVWLDA